LTIPSRIIPVSSRSTKRYIGAFGVTGWATRSGLGLLTYGETVKIERTKPQVTGAARFGRPAAKRADVVVRFTNSRGEEVGRLENEYAAWISTLLDQRICQFEGVCVFAPDRIRTNDNVYLQIRSYLLPSAFEASGFAKLDTNRRTLPYNVGESDDEKSLRLKQVALVKLFDEINLKPSRSSAQNEKHKREGLLQAADSAERRSEDKSASAVKVSKAEENGSASPSDEAEEGEELEQDQLDALYKKAQTFDFNTPETEPVDTFRLTLRKYQKQALYWMTTKEKDERSHEAKSMHPLWEEYTWPVKDMDGKELPIVDGQNHFYVNPYSGELSLAFPAQEQNCLGGILADEMGLGKTIEMLSLIHSHKANLAGDVPFSLSAPDVTWAPTTTLVVAPMSLLAQWQSEAEKASEPNSLKAMLYYGNEKSANLRNLCCEANATNVPNVIITSYGVILSEYNQIAAEGGSRKSHNGLFSLEYFRVILDEAHFIKNRLAKTAKACYEIQARHRWALTGTPIVNRLEDLFSQVHFLKVEPWSNFSYWKTFITVPFEAQDFIRALDVVQTVLEPLVLRRTKSMKTPDGEDLVPLPARHINIEKVTLSKNEREVYDCIFSRASRTFAENVEAGTLLKSYTTIFAQILRLRQTCCHPLLTRNKNIVAEADDVATAADLAKGLADDMDLDFLLDRFTADLFEEDVNKFGVQALRQIQEEARQECPICCEDPMTDQTVTGCWHSACKKCLVDYIDHQKDRGKTPTCFNCRKAIDSREVFQVVRHDPIPVNALQFAVAGTQNHRISLRRVGCEASAKITSLLRHLTSIRNEAPTMKSVVFSQFTSFLDLIEPALKRDHIDFLRLDGTMAQKQRAAVLTEFTSRKTGAVLLLSLRAGGVGLNLTAAKRVFMMDPWWSFAVEAQAIDRVHRMGQEDEVIVTRFVVEESIEEKMLRIQERKKFM
jgi:DNA repair protein RAD5